MPDGEKGGGGCVAFPKHAGQLFQSNNLCEIIRGNKTKIGSNASTS